MSEFADWIRDELLGMLDRSDVDYLQALPDEDLELAFGDNAHSQFWDEFRSAVAEMAKELIFERDNE